MLVFLFNHLAVVSYECFAWFASDLANCALYLFYTQAYVFHLSCFLPDWSIEMHGKSKDPLLQQRTPRAAN